MKFSDFDLREPLSSTSFRIFETVDSPNSLVVLIFSTPLIFTQPLITSLPSTTSFGRLSPVSALVFIEDNPLSTIPSSGIFSPG
ncbi:hypothetical protein IMSAG250_00547 [Clostridiales bacterium]|nr:hypothetical protein IMSAG250_00547 [Clostridiales bacterium]